ncbi:hypothetical protein EYF80_028490 [Liparis tanakae]|uniref:Uncharacterized protein n=1 Tax=Liparis tanakae TaxID=230148 RepID=A0A4Z2H5Y1_9TELE|nr:hypothetical protein EYF80_028490 [Liparis tanakae]
MFLSGVERSHADAKRSRESEIQMSCKVQMTFALTSTRLTSFMTHAEVESARRRRERGGGRESEDVELLGLTPRLHCTALMEDITHLGQVETDPRCTDLLQLVLLQRGIKERSRL